MRSQRIDPIASAVRGKVALVTGGASGIGAALVARLADAGAEVWIADRQLDSGERLARRLRRLGGIAHAVELDVRDAAAFQGVVDEVVKKSGHLDYLFNNAGIGVGGEVDSYTLADWTDVFDVNLLGVVHGIQAAYPVMIKQGHGHIVNTASMSGLIPSPGMASYSASKHAVVGLSKALRIEAARHGVTVTALCPGVIKTPILTGGAYGRGRPNGKGGKEFFGLPKGFRPMAPEPLAERALRAVVRRDAIAVMPASWKPSWYLERFSPGLSLRFVEAVARSTRPQQP
ncbi:SDR family NAD(P)-dependent oxidoreductase [Mycobacterium sp. smrl_JER01]|uniref:SDR family NAD(P)-dependent oxidoreductase n=1 Tax=Mycobacterium sp. smrl_JER01 TaxID=3402633 RepID=UPI003AD41CAB